MSFDTLQNIGNEIFLYELKSPILVIHRTPEDFLNTTFNLSGKFKKMEREGEHFVGAYPGIIGNEKKYPNFLIVIYLKSFVFNKVQWSFSIAKLSI